MKKLETIDPKCQECDYVGNCLYENSETCGVLASACCECECGPCLAKKLDGKNKFI